MIQRVGGSVIQGRGTRDMRQRPLIEPVIPGYTLWFEGSRGFPYIADWSSVTSVPAWHDMSSSSNSLGGVTGTVQTGRFINGRSGVDFVSQSGLSITFDSADLTSTMYAVLLPDSFSTPRGFWCGNISGGLQYRFETTTGKFQALKHQVAGMFTTTAAASAGSALVVSSALTGTTWRAIVGSNSAESGSHAQTLTSNASTFMGRSALSGEAFDGIIAEFIWYGTTHSTTEQDIQHAALRAKYGL